MDKISEDKFTFRHAEPADSEEICILVNSVYRGENSRKGWTTEADMLDGIRITSERVNELILSNNSIILVVCEDNKIVGCVHLEKHGSKCHLGMLSVDVNYQNQGHGKILMDKSEEYAKNEFKCNMMEMKVIGQRTELIEFYLRRGYIKTGDIEYFTLNTHFGNPKIDNLYFEYFIKKI